MNNIRWLTAFALFVACALPAQAFAADPPGRVGRVAWIQGEVAVYSDPERGWEKAWVNSPVTTENSLWTEPNARAELRVGATALRLEEATQLDLRLLDEEQLRAHVPRGRLAVRVRHFEKAERYIVTTPQARLLIGGNGRYRIDFDSDDGASLFTVFAGTAQLDVEGRRVNVEPGDAVRVNDRGQFDFQRAAASEFDQWTLARDERVLDSQATRYVSPRMTGYEDLDAYGQWSQEPDFGTVWYPTSVGADYVPYRDGHWAHVRPWGWTWVDHAPWGYAPFHYGRWVYVRDRWGWCPGRYAPRPIWAPALVGWVGRPGWSLTIGSGLAPVVGWYPLAPWDRYQPWYTNNATYINNVNVVVVNRPPRYRDHDWNRQRGSTVVGREVFVSERPVRNARVSVSSEVIAAQPIASGVAVLPSRSEVRTKPMAIGGQPAARVAPSQSAPGQAAPSRLAPAPAAPAANPAYRVSPQAQPVQPARPAQAAPANPAGRLSAPSASGQPSQSPPAVNPAYRTPSSPAVQPAQSAPYNPNSRLGVPNPGLQSAPRTAPVAAPAPVVRPAPTPVPEAVVAKPVAKPAAKPVKEVGPEAKPEKIDKPEPEQRPAGRVR